MKKLPPHATVSTAQNNKTTEDMINHIVTFRLNGTREQRLETSRRFRDALMALPAQIDVLESMQVGINENDAEDWDVVLIARVPTLEDVNRYASHPAHVAAAQIVAPLKRDRACVDFAD